MASDVRNWATAGDRIAGLVLVAIASLVLWESRVLPLGSINSPGPAFMPIALAIVVLISGALLVVVGGPKRIESDEPTDDVDAWKEWRRVAIILATAALATWALERLGYRLTVVAVLLFLVGVVERRNPLAALLFALVIAFSTFYVFDTVLRVQLPRGPFNI